MDDYDTLFAARHGREALDPVPRVSEQIITTTSLGIPPPITGPELIKEKAMSAHDIAHPNQRDQVSLSNEASQP